MAHQTKRQMRKTSPVPPMGWRESIKWYGPAFLWVLSSVGSGATLFTPRIGSEYGYGLLWTALIVIFFQWVMIHEVGRYTVITGRTLLDGFNDLPGPRGWAIWFIFLPQVVAAIVTIAGIAALAGSALMIAFPGNQAMYAVLLLVISIILVVTGRYKWVQRVCSALAGVLVLAAITSALSVFPPAGDLASGLIPTIPENLDPYFILPWLGFILAGAAGIIWFSYWVVAAGYGGEVHDDEEERAEKKEERQLSHEELIARLHRWQVVMRNTAIIAIFSGGLILISFLILGAEILRPEGIVPEGIAVAEDLTNLLAEIWGAVGRWILLIGIFIALWGTILANQDGWGRMFADSTYLLWPKKIEAIWKSKKKGWTNLFLGSREKLKNTYAITTTALIPLVVFLVFREPVDILSVAGIIAAAHTPVVVFLTLHMNRKTLPREFAPGIFLSTMMVITGLFFAAFAGIYLLDLVGIQIL